MVSIIPPGQLVFGMQLPVQAQSLVFAEPWESTAGPAELAQVAQAADRHGMFYVGVCDHVAIPREYAKRMGTTWYDTIATLAWIAAQTEHVRLLSHVFVLAYRSPLVAAKSFSTLDHLSGGRVIAGVGAGHVEAEFAAVGADFARRGPVLDESLAGFTAALEDEYPVLDGEVSGLGARPRPAQTPRPPVWVGGSSPAAVRRAGRSADGWLPQGTPREDMPQLIAMLHEERKATHGDVGGDDGVEIGAITEWLYVGTPSWDVGRPCISGSAQQLAEDLREYGAMGVSHLQVRFPSRSVDELVDQVAAFGDAVGPLLRR